MAEDYVEQYLQTLEEDDTVQEDRSDVDMKKLGYALRKEQKQRKTVEKELEELRKFREEAVRKEREAALTAAGLTVGQAKAYQAMYEDVNAESLDAFKAEVLGFTSEPEPVAEPVADTPEPAIPVPGMAPVQVTNAAAAGPKQYTAKELAEILRTDPARADQLLAEGRVKLGDWNDLYAQPE